MDFTKEIYFNKDKVYENSKLSVTYTGSLFQNNSDKVFISYGYGKLWDNQNEIELLKTKSGFTGTLEIKTGTDIQFCFHDSNNNWDNNNNNNYIAPILKKEIKEETKEENLLEFEPIVESEKEIDLKINNQTSENQTAPFKPVTISSEEIDIYSQPEKVIVPEEINVSNAQKLDNIETSTIPEKTVINEIKIDVNSEKHTVSEKVISFESLKGNKENLKKAFDDNQVTAGSVYVSSLIGEYQQKIAKEPQSTEPPKFIEDITITSTALVPAEEKSVAEKGLSKIYVLKKKIKLSISKFIKLIKTALNYNEDKI
ncbi:MAG: hypothetical protein IKG42_03005 [Clostridia bacterium]|nr:hypothetical protein [Clostridia bacterium]